MTRLALIPAAVTSGLAAGPALAHSNGTAHLHETDSMTLMLGFSLIGLGAGAALFLKARKK